MPSYKIILLLAAIATLHGQGGYIQQSGGGGGTPAAPDFSVQFNNGMGQFGGSADLTWTTDGLTNLRHAAIGADATISPDLIFYVSETLTGPLGEALAVQISPVFSATEDGAGVAGIASNTATAGAFDFGEVVALTGYAIHGGDGEVTNLTGLQFGAVSVGGGSAVNAFGVKVPSSSGTITNVYGVWVEDQAAGSNNWAIKTGLGLVEFGDDLMVTQLASPSGLYYVCVDDTGLLVSQVGACV